MRRKLFVVALFAVLAGCTSYYAVTDPATGKTFYTDKVDKQNGGAVSLKDAKSGDTVTLQNSAIRQIDKSQFDAATATTQAGK